MIDPRTLIRWIVIAMAYKQDGFALRTEVALRARYPHLSTRLFEDRPGSYVITFDSSHADTADIAAVFDEQVRPVTLPIVVSKKVPEKFVRELTTLTRYNVSDDFLGFSFNLHDLRHLLASRFPTFPVLADPLPNERFPRLRFDRAPTADEKAQLLSVLNGIYPGWPFEIADAASPTPPQERKEVPGEIDIDVRAARLRPSAPPFVRKDEEFFWANYKHAFGGYRSGLDIPALADLGQPCFVDASVFEQIDIRQLLFHFDTILLCLPLADQKHTNFWQKQSFSKDDLLYLVEVGRVKIVQKQPEERLDLKLLEEINERNRLSIVGRQTAALVLAHDLALTSSDYILARDDLRVALRRVAADLGEQLGVSPTELLKALLWPVGAHLESIAPLARRGLLGISAFSSGELIVGPLKRATGKDFELEAVMMADHIHVAHAFNATFIPPLGDLSASWTEPGRIIGRQLNYYRGFNGAVAAQWAANERRREERRAVLPPLPLFDIHPSAPVADLHALTSRRSTTSAGRALIGRLADLPESERAVEVRRLIDELYLHGIKKAKWQLGMDIAGDVAGVAKFAFGGAATIPFSTKLIGHLIQAARRVRGCDMLADTLERDIGGQFGRNEDLEFLSKVERVATLQRQSMHESAVSTRYT